MDLLTTARRYEGTGTLDHGDGTPPIACECVATQEQDGRVRLECVSRPDAPSPVNWMEGIFGPPPHATLFKGHLKNGLSIKAEGTLLGHVNGWNRDHGTRATFHLTGKSRLAVGSPHDDTDWRFAIVNLVFSVPHDRQPSANPRSRSLTLVLPDGPLAIEQVADYEDVKRELRGRHAVRVTAEVCVPRSVSFDRALGLVDDLCSVLSLAEGTLVNWISASSAMLRGNSSLPFIIRPSLDRITAPCR